MTGVVPALIGGHALLDLINTVVWRGDPARRRDRLPDAAALARWCSRVDLLADAETVALAGAADLGTLARVRELRETARPVLAAVAHDTTPEPTDLGALHRIMVNALRHATPQPELPLHWSVPVHKPADLPRRLALTGLELLCSPEVTRVRECADTACGALFLDRSRSHTRRWCSSTDCGNRARVRRHYHRRHRSVASGVPRSA